MAVDFTVKDGHGSGNRLKVNGEGEIGVVIHPHPPRDEEIPSTPFREYFIDSAGSSDMVVNGATTNVTFSINASSTQDTYVKTIAVVIVDAGATLSEFGNLSALSNGIKFEWDTQDIGATIINDGIKTNFEFFRQALQEPIIQNNVVGAAEGILINIDMQKLLGLQYGLRLRKGTNDKLSFIVRDNLSGITQFDAIAYGIKF